MKLYLVQHGLAVSKDVDPGRPLSPQGTEEVQRIALFLKSAGFGVDKILHSGKMRAHQTAEILADALLVSGEVETISGLNPKDPVRDFSRNLPDITHNTMLVGHLPFMSRLTALLVAGNEDLDIVEFKPGSVVCLQHDPELNWRIQWMLRPDTLGKIAE